MIESLTPRMVGARGHERILQRFFKFKADAVGFMQGEQDDSGNQAAGDRLGNIEVS